MSFLTAAGASLKASAAAPATYDSTGYAALTFTAVGEITNIGEFGKQFALVTHQPLASRGVKKGKGSFNNGTLNPTLAIDSADAGQGILKTALESDSPISFEVELQNGDIYYLEAMVMSFPTTVGSVDDVIIGNPVLEITDNPIVEVTA